MLSKSWDYITYFVQIFKACIIEDSERVSACRRCSNYIFILDLTPGFDGLGKGNCMMRRESFKFWFWVRLKLEILRH